MTKSLLKYCIFTLITIIPFAFSEKEEPGHSVLSKYYNTNYNQLIKRINEFDKTLEKGIKNKEIYYTVRSQFKKIEPILLYIDPSGLSKGVNGAPLLKLEENTPGYNELKPHGLQVIDEMMGNDDVIAPEILKELNVLKAKLKGLNTSIVPRISKFTHRKAIELFKVNLIKIISLEQTGFDTPGTLHGVEDSKVTLSSINKILSIYLDRTSRVEAEIKELTALSEKASLILNKSKDFEEFDRLNFLVKYVEPLFSKINNIHEKSGIEFHHEVSRYPLPFNPKANHIFADDFLDPTYFTGFEETEEMISLGKTLFYDPILSSNNQRACASCHSPQKGFTDQKKKSEAFDFKGTVNRNSPTIINAVYSTDYFWDLRAEQLRNQVEHVVFSEKEFNIGFSRIEEKLRSSKEYQDLFQNNFPPHNGEVINKGSITQALATYVQSVRGWNSEFDKYVRNESEHLNNNVKQGYNLFMGKGQCGICHFAPSFSGLVPPYFRESESEVLGVTTKFDTINPVLDSDLGRGASTKIKDQWDNFNHSFKTPTVRNSAITFPYMHNGAFETLEEVIHFYNHGGGAGLGLEVNNQTLPDSKLLLSEKEIHQIKSFLESLTDTTSIDTSVPKSLPFICDSLSNRVIGGEY